MKLSELTAEIVAAHCGISDSSTETEQLLEMYKAAAVAFVLGYTGISADELDNFEDITVASYVAKAAGQLQITMPSLDNSDEVLLFGKTYDETTKTVTNNKDDYVPAVMAIYSTKRADGTVNLYKVMKVKFTEGAENIETQDDSGAKFQSVQISGDYEQLIKNGDDVIMLRGVDPSTSDGKTTITAWFSSALGGLPADKYPSD